ncbi:hypothetical protein [Buttiauxella noackiae]|uniref:hypothetical protein n=1 Tax=Buttiauxella noackiae TaxID=82992 RepID=UPI0028D77FAB|nr:hypothetical protein [Buttiauxella noackiae]
MIKRMYASTMFVAIFFSGVSHADITIQSPTGGRLTFLQEKSGEHYEKNAWGKIIFSRNSYSADLSRDDRYYTEDGSSKVSPSGKYLIVSSVSGGNVEFGDGTSKYTDRAYCSVINMTNGCIISDWDGEACGYTWVGGKDVLASSEDSDGDIFDFNSMKPSMNKIKNKLSSMNLQRTRNMLRCDSPSKENINQYQQLVKENEKAKKIVTNAISDYVLSIANESLINTKSNLYSAPEGNSQTKAYLVPGDKIKIIQYSPDNQWVNIGYMNSKGSPLIAWIKADALVK